MGETWSGDKGPNNPIYLPAGGQLGAEMPTPQGKQYALTYPRCEVSKERAMEILRQMADVESVVVAQETHAEADAEGGSGMHLHAYVKFTTQKRRSTESFEIDGHHGDVQICRNVRAWITYITKEDKEPACHNFDVEECLKKKRAVLTAAMAATMTAEEIGTQVRAELYRRVREGARLYRLETSKPLRTQDVRGIWVYGEKGAGKSHLEILIEEAGIPLYIKQRNKWWDGYDLQEVALLQDLEKEDVWAGPFLKVWADRFRVVGEIKGGMVPLRHKVFVVTSNYLPEHIWTENSTLMETVERRFKIFHMTLENREEVQAEIMATIRELMEREEVEEGEGEPADKHAPE